MNLSRLRTAKQLLPDPAPQLIKGLAKPLFFKLA
jgi:hypothetical protein